MFKNLGQFNYSEDYSYTKLYLVADIEGKTIHVMDLNEKKTKSLTNTVYDNFITIIFEHAKKVEPSIRYFRDEYRYFLYHTDGDITEFKNSWFSNIKESEEILPTGFMKIIEERREKNRNLTGLHRETDTAKRLFK